MAEFKEEIGGMLMRLIQKKAESSDNLVVEDEELLITREECPALLLPVNKNLPEILLVQRLTQGTKRHHSTSSNTSSMCTTPLAKRNGHTPVTNGHSDATDLDVTGSPLKCPFMQNGSESNVSPFTITCDLQTDQRDNASLPYTPVSSMKAGVIASVLSLELNKICRDVDECLPLWVVCDGKDSRGTLFIGLHLWKEMHRRVLVTSGGPYTGMKNVPSLELLRDHHLAFGPTKRVDTSVEATYIIQASEDAVRSSSVSLTCTWKDPLAVLSSPAPCASTTANVYVVCGDPRSAAYEMHKELSALRRFVCGLEKGEVEWFVHDSSKSITEELQELFASIKEKGMKIKREGEGSCDLDMMIEGKLFNRRQNMDFIDLLWSILMKCQSYQELKNSLGLVFKAVAEEEVRPQIHVRDTTEVGCLLRNLMKNREGLPDLSGLKPLHMLIEIGYEKIRKDYINIFQGGQLVIAEQLAWFVGSRAVGSTESMEHKVDQLGRLHVALQVVLALRTYLCLNLNSLSRFTAQVLKQMEKQQPSSSHSFSLKIDTLLVYPQFESMKEDTWEVTFSSQEETYKKFLVCKFSQAPLIQFQTGLSGKDDEFMEVKVKESEEEDEEEDYFCSFFLIVEDKLQL